MYSTVIPITFNVISCVFTGSQEALSPVQHDHISYRSEKDFPMIVIHLTIFICTSVRLILWLYSLSLIRRQLCITLYIYKGMGCLSFLAPILSQPSSRQESREKWCLRRRLIFTINVCIQKEMMLYHMTDVDYFRYNRRVL